MAFAIGRSQVDLNNPIKTIGLHTVPLALHADVNVDRDLQCRPLRR
jgi:large subunit ribosomal protein L9